MPQRTAPSARCQVPGCRINISRLPAYYSRYRICQQHVQMEQVELCGGELCRFCQLCGRFHPLEAFDDARRSCRARLAKHNARRKLKLEMEAGMPSVQSKALKRRSTRKSTTHASTPERDSAQYGDTSSASETESDTHTRDMVLDNETLKQELNLHHLVLPSCKAELATDASSDSSGLMVTLSSSCLEVSAPPPTLPPAGPRPSCCAEPTDLETSLCGHAHHHHRSVASPIQSPATCFSSGCGPDESDLTGDYEVLFLWRQWGGEPNNLPKPSSYGFVMDLSLGPKKHLLGPCLQALA